MNPQHYHYTPHHEPSPPSSSIPTTHYLAVSSSSSSSTNAVIIRHCRHPCHHRVGCCLVPPAATSILTIIVHRRCNPTNDGVPAASPHCDPPPRRRRTRRRRAHRRRALSALSIAHGAVMDWHAASMPFLPVRRGKCRSRRRPPRRDTGPLRQRRRHDRRNASVSSPAAGGIPSFTSRAATAGRATVTAAWQRGWSSLATRRRDDDTVTMTPDCRGQGVVWMWLYLIYIEAGAAFWPGLYSTSWPT